MFSALWLFIFSLMLIGEMNPSKDESNKTFKNTDFLNKPFLIFCAIFPCILLLLCFLRLPQVRNKLGISLEKVDLILYSLWIVAFVLLVYLCILCLIQPKEKFVNSEGSFLEQKWLPMVALSVAIIFDVIAIFIIRGNIKSKERKKVELEKLRAVYDSLMSS